MIAPSECCTRRFLKQLSPLWGPFKIDVFASRLDKQVDNCVLWKPHPSAAAVDAFSMLWDQNPFYAFHLLPSSTDVYKDHHRRGSQGVMVLPMWPTHMYYPSTMSMLIQLPRLFTKEGEPIETAPYPKSATHYGRKCSWWHVLYPEKLRDKGVPEEAKRNHADRKSVV